MAFIYCDWQIQGSCANVNEDAKKIVERCLNYKVLIKITLLCYFKKCRRCVSMSVILRMRRDRRFWSYFFFWATDEG